MAARPLAIVARNGAAPAEALLHPATLVALGLLVLNDHVLKAAFPGVVTGKLSDLAGLAFFPILVVSGWELVQALSGGWRAPSRRALAIAIGITAAAFTLVKTLPVAAEAFGWALGLAQWLLALPVRALAGGPLPEAAPAAVVVDPTDLVALVALVVPVWTWRERARFDQR
jgi:hypothetical protein